MGIKTDTFFDDAAAKRNRLIYLLCGIVTIACVGTILVLSGGDEKDGAPRDDDPKVAAKEESGDPLEPKDRPPVSTFNDEGPTPPVSRLTGPAAEAQKLFDQALDCLREARDIGPGKPETTALKHKALAAFAEAKAIYENWLEEHPGDGDRYEKKIADIQRQIFWTKRNMSASEFPDAGGAETAAGASTDDGPGDADAKPVDVPKPPPTPTRPPINPDIELKRFMATARTALRQGKPGPVVEHGRKLLEDDRMSAQHEGIAKITESAADMVEFLSAARDALGKRKGQSVTLDLRNGTATGVLASADEEIVLRVGDGDVNYAVTDLSAKQLTALATESEYLTNGYAHGAAGSYFFQRGDREAGFEQLLRARAGGVDLGQFNPVLDEKMKRSKSLQALNAWLTLEPRLGEASDEVLTLIAQFRSLHRGTEHFTANRDRIFKAAATAAAGKPFEIESLWYGGVKPSSRGKIKLEYSFEDAEELKDFGFDPRVWTLNTGSLYGQKNSIWIEKFNLASADVTMTVPGPSAVVLGLWARDRSGRGGVNLRMYPKDGDLVFELRHGDRPFGIEKIKMPSGAITVTLQKREDKYQVRVNRKMLLRATDNTRHAGEKLHTVGVAARGGPVVIEDLTIASTVDMDWAKAGGSKFGTWIRDWYIAGPYAVSPKILKAALVKEMWPEAAGFDPAALGEDGKPRWRPVLSPDDWVDLNRLKPNRNCVVYQAIRVWSPDKRSAILEFVCDDSARVWLNGSVVIKAAPLFEPQRVSVKLKPGDNVLMVKVMQSGGGWWSATRFLTKGGGPMRALSYW